MSILNWSLQHLNYTTAQIAASTSIPLNGQIIYNNQTGKYCIGDGTTALNALTFYGGISISGLTVGTTTITSGTNTRILYNNSGVVGEYLVTGTGTTAVLSTSPTFTTDITTPLIIGGSSVGSVLTLKGTSGSGTSTVAAHQFLVGNNGATTAAVIYNSGNVNIGNATNTSQRLVRIGQDTAYIDIGSLVGTTSSAALHMNQVTPSGTNYFLRADSSGNYYINGGMNGGNLTIRLNDNNIMSANTTAITWTPRPVSAGNPIPFQIQIPNNTGQGTGVNSPQFKITGNTTQWATGALATQYFNYFSANTVSFVGASTATNVYGLYVEAATSGTNATITNNYAAGFGGMVVVNMPSTNVVLRELVSVATYGAVYLGNITPSSSNFALASDSVSTVVSGTSFASLRVNGIDTIAVTATAITFYDNRGIVLGTTNGNKIGTATNQKLGFWNATPIVQPTTAYAAATFVANAGTAVNDASTFDGYTMKQVVAALRGAGLLA